MTTERPTTTTTEPVYRTPYVPGDGEYGSNAGQEAIEDIDPPEPQSTQPTCSGAVRCGYRPTDPVGCHPADDPVWDVADELARRDMQATIDSLEREIDCSAIINGDPNC